MLAAACPVSRRNLQSLAGVRRSSTIWGVASPENITLTQSRDKLLLAAGTGFGFLPFLFTSVTAQANLCTLALRGEAVFCLKPIL